MGKGGRFGKYGEKKRLNRLRETKLKPPPFKISSRFGKRKPKNYFQTNEL